MARARSPASRPSWRCVRTRSCYGRRGFIRPSVRTSFALCWQQVSVTAAFGWWRIRLAARPALQTSQTSSWMLPCNYATGGTIASSASAMRQAQAPPRGMNWRLRRLRQPLDMDEGCRVSSGSRHMSGPPRLCVRLTRGSIAASLPGCSDCDCRHGGTASDRRSIRSSVGCDRQVRPKPQSRRIGAVSVPAQQTGGSMGLLGPVAACLR